MNRVRALAYAAVALGAVALVIVITGGASNGYTVRAEFRDVDGLREGSTVKVDGVAAGSVTSLTVTPRSTAMATLTLDPGVGPVGTGASVQVRPTDLLGERYAQLDVGNQSHPLPAGSLIPISRTSAPVDLDDVLNMLDADTRARLRILINESGIALSGRGADFNTLLAQLPPDLGQAQQLLGQVASENASLQNLITQGNQVTAAVSGKRSDMGHVIDVADQALGSVAQRQAALGQTIAGAPAALSQLQTTLHLLGAAADAITPAAVSLQQTAGPLTATLRELPPFAGAAAGTLVTARRIAPRLTELGVQARAPLAALRPTAVALQQVTSAAAPILSEEDARGMRDLLWFIENWALALKGRDALGHFVGAELEIDPSILASAVDAFANNSGLSSSLHRQQSVAPAAARKPSGAPAAPSRATPAGSGSGSAQPATGAPAAAAAPSPQAAPASSPAAPPLSPGAPTNSIARLLNFLIGR
jgi:phospholipid/cholesterol/gamma-HCH transport system substrate-binding protein